MKILVIIEASSRTLLDKFKEVGFKDGEFHLVYNEEQAKSFVSRVDKILIHHEFGLKKIAEFYEFLSEKKFDLRNAYVLDLDGKKLSPIKFITNLKDLRGIEN